MKTFWILLVLYLGIFSKGWAEEVLNCVEPRDWGQVYDIRERWGGPDPTIGYRRGSDSIQVTHYGLKDSQFKTPEEYISWIKKVIGEPLFGDKTLGGEIQEMTVVGKTAKWLQFQYKHEGFTDHHGAVIPSELVHEEFVIVPVENGFWALVLSNYRVAPFGPTPDKSPKEETSKLELLLQTWKQFLKGCRSVSS